MRFLWVFYFMEKGGYIDIPEVPYGTRCNFRSCLPGGWLGGSGYRGMNPVCQYKFDTGYLQSTAVQAYHPVLQFFT